jgi:hypothetical protein
MGRTLLLTALASSVLHPDLRRNPQQRAIAVDETALPRSLRARALRHLTFDSLVVVQLEAAGFAIIRPETTAAVWRHIRDSVGGFYDRYTGRLLDDKLGAVTVGTLALLRERYHAAAWLRPFVTLVHAPFAGGKVKWDGVEEGSGGRGGLGGFLLGEHSGTLPALSFTVFLDDSAGRTIYHGVGGLQLAARLEEGRIVDMPPDSLLTDDAAIVRAVHLALDSLPTGFRPTGGP